MSERIAQYSRRDVLRAAGVLIATPPLVAACENKPAPDLYNGPIVDLKGRPLITDARFTELTQALVKSGEPLLERIGTEVGDLHSQKGNPPDLPSNIVNEKTTPLAVTRDYSEYAYAEIFTSPDKSNPGFLFDNGSTVESWLYSKPAILGINVATSKQLQERDPIDESLFLAKEYVTLMLAVRMFSEYGKFLPEGQRFLELDGSEMYDTDALARAGLAVGSSQLNDFSSMFTKMGDIVPVLILMPSIIDLGRRGVIPDETDTLGNFYQVANIVLRNPDLYDALTNLSDSWLLSDSLIGPNDAVDQIQNPLIQNAVLDAYDVVYPEGVSMIRRTAWTHFGSLISQTA